MFTFFIYKTFILIMIKYVYITFITTILISCTNTKNVYSLKLDMDVIIEKTDSIAIYYSLTNSVDFKGEESYWLKIKGGKKNQKISFSFPDTIQPKQVRIDFGRNILQPKIVINKICFSYKSNDFCANGEGIYRLFRIDDSNTRINKLDGSLRRKNSLQIAGPSLYPKGNKLYFELNQLYSEK